MQRGLTCTTAATIVLLAFAALAASAPAEQRSPGVVVRICDIGRSVSHIPELAPGQLPNIARIEPTIDLGGDGRSFGPIEDNFYTEVTGYIHAPAAATYRFRLISDDGSRLWINGRLVVDHDGLHGPVPKDGDIELKAGWHPLRITHFEATGGERLLLQWRSLIATAIDAFETVPESHLAHDRDEDLSTAPGVKRIIPALRRGLPGDGSPLADVHPSLAAEPVEPERLVEAGALDRHLDDRLAVLGGWSVRDAQPPGDHFVWLPPSHTAYAASEATRIPAGVYADQLLVAENPGGGLYRIFVDDAGDGAQGCAFRFSAGVPETVGALSWDSHGNLYVGAERDAPSTPRIVKLTPTGRTPFEMLAVRTLSNGLEITFTQPLDPRVGWEADSYHVERWPYAVEPASRNGLRPPQRDGSTIPVKSASVSDDRRSVFLEVDGLEPRAVIYVRLLPPSLSESGELPWATEAWLTLERGPAAARGVVAAPPPRPPQNVLTDEQKAAGWRLLFDGQTTRGWRGFRRETMPDGWQVIDGCLVRVGPGGDIITEEQFESFELELEWRISAGGNSGIFYHVSEAPQHRYVWQTGPEFQILDNREHADGRASATSAGANYALHAPPRDVTEPVGLFNHARIVVRGPHVEHWLNGEKIVEYELGGEDWERRVAASKFAAMPDYGRAGRGHIALQDHGDRVWFRNIRIRELD